MKTPLENGLVKLNTTGEIEYQMAEMKLFLRSYKCTQTTEV
jgi:hypothetical protein